MIMIISGIPGTVPPWHQLNLILITSLQNDCQHIIISLGSLEVCKEAWCTRNSDFDQIRLFSYLHFCSAHSLSTRSGL